MEIKIFDVSHGFCALMIADNGNLMLIDCGDNRDTGFSPSKYLKGIRCNGIEKLVIQNYDQDHISDLPNIYGSFPIQVLYRNKSITPDSLRRLKLQSGPLTTAMAKLIEMSNEFCHPISTTPEFPNTTFSFYYHDYPEFKDTNNLSMVTFIQCGSTKIAFTGDLEKEGWTAHLRNAAFVSDLQKVNIFVASHHGRETGYCEEVFNYCSPDLVIISDKEIIHETQAHNLYISHAKGIMWNKGPEKRYVLTTRSDGMMTITNRENGFYVQTSK